MVQVSPWSKTGGLADVMGSLPGGLAQRGNRVMVIAPRYGIYPDAFDTGHRFKIWLFGGEHEVGVFHCRKNGVDWVFVDHPSYLRAGNPYGDENGDFGDNQFRYALLCNAAVEIPLQVKFQDTVYGDDNLVFICNDWHAALVPVIIPSKYRPHGVYTNARSVLALHNLRHQGVYPPFTYNMLNLPSDWYGALEFQYPPHMRQGAYEEEGRCVNTLKAGISCADRVVTVSPGYAWEVTTPEGGWMLDGLLASRQYVLTGVLNGIDMDEWNPAKDPHIPYNYSNKNFIRGKNACKAALQKELCLPERPEVPLIGFVGRLDYQKGADLIMGALPWLVDNDCQLVMLGTGDKGLENALRVAETNHKDKVRAWVGFNVPMSHKITAACDILLMPSRFEPCGLNQLYAMRYGTVPVAHATGGLRDTVIDYNPYEKTGTGWTFNDLSVDGLLHALGTAAYTYREHPMSFQEVQKNGMCRDSSWDQAAAEYEKVFDWALTDGAYCS